jgi:RimJ/RimL family protein N-acetyltransferase
MILGKRIRCRAIEQADLPRFVNWLNDPEVYRYLTMFMPLSQASEENWFDHTLQKPAEEQPLVIEIVSQDEWMPIGVIDLHTFNWRARSAELGIFIGEKMCWNQGFGQEAVRLIVKHGFNTLNLNRIFLRVYETNSRAIHTYERVGFIKEGSLRQAVVSDGHYVNEIIMSILRSEWRDEEK